MNYITHSLKEDYSIFIELCSYHSNQFGTHHSKEKLNNPQSPSSLSCSPAPDFSMNLLSVFTNLLIQEFYIIAINNMWSFGNAFCFQYTLSSQDSTTSTNSD